MDLKSLVAEFQNYHYSDKVKVDNAEFYYALWAARPHSNIANVASSIKTSQLSSEIAAIRKQINDVLASDADDSTAKHSHNNHHHHHHEEKHDDINKRVTHLESENKHMKSQISDLKDLVEKLQATIGKLTVSSGATTTAAGDSSKPIVEPAAKKDAEAEDEIDLFGSDEEEDEEAAKIKEQRLKAYQEKKAKKPGPIAKSSVILDVKPWDDETDMAKMENDVRSIVMDGLLWGASKLVPVGYGIKKLQIMCVVEDDKVSVEELQEKIEAFDDFVQSVDIAAFNKI